MSEETIQEIIGGYISTLTTKLDNKIGKLEDIIERQRCEIGKLQYALNANTEILRNEISNNHDTIDKLNAQTKNHISFSQIAISSNHADIVKLQDCKMSEQKYAPYKLGEYRYVEPRSCFRLAYEEINKTLQCDEYIIRILHNKKFINSQNMTVCQFLTNFGNIGSVACVKCDFAKVNDANYADSILIDGGSYTFQTYAGRQCNSPLDIKILKLLAKDNIWKSLIITRKPGDSCGMLNALRWINERKSYIRAQTVNFHV